MAQVTTFCRWRLLPRRSIRIPDPAFAGWGHVSRWNIDVLRRWVPRVDDYYGFTRTTHKRV
jgi:hypothetical protein